MTLRHIYDCMWLCTGLRLCTGVMPHCLDAGSVTSVTVEEFDGQNWEETMKSEALKEDSIINRSKSSE